MHGMRIHTVLIVVVVLLASWTGGCANNQPRYPVASVEFDPQLLGTWWGRDTDGNEMTIRIESKPVAVENHRLNPLGKHPESARASIQRLQSKEGKAEDPVMEEVLPERGTSDQTIQQYRITVPLEPPPAIDVAVFDGYLLKVGDSRLIGLQLAELRTEEERVTIEPLQMLFLPVHFVVKIEFKEGLLRAALPSQEAPIVVWMPLIKALDKPVSLEHAMPIAQRKEASRFLLAESEDRLIEYYTSVVNDPAKWEPMDESRALKRVGP